MKPSKLQPGDRVGKAGIKYALVFMQRFPSLAEHFLSYDEAAVSARMLACSK